MESRWQRGVGGNGFLAKLNPDGSVLDYSTYLYGVGYATGVAVDQAGNAHVAGASMGGLPLVNAVQTNAPPGGIWAGCVIKLDPDGQSALYSTYLGGDQGAWCTGIAVDRNGSAWLVGNTHSTNFPTVNPVQPAASGGEDAFVARISDPDTNPPVILAASNYGDPAVVTVDFSEAVDVASATNVSNYRLDQGVIVSAATMGVNSRTVRLLTSGLTNGTTYTLAASGVRDRAPVPNFIAPDTQLRFTALGLYRGCLRQEFYGGSFGTVADLSRAAEFPAQPESSETPHQFEILSGSLPPGGMRLSGYLLPPVTGDYTFHLSSANQGTLLLSPNESPLNAVQIAFDPYGGGPRQWIHYPAGFLTNPPPNISLPVRLEAGRAYYIESRAVSDRPGVLGVTWRVPGGPAPLNKEPPIAGNHLAVLASPLEATLAIVEEPQDVVVAEGQTAAFSLKVTASPPDVFHQWRRNGVEIPDANGSSFITPELTPANTGDQYDCVLTIPGATATSRAALLTVTNDPTPPRLLAAEGGFTLTQITLTFSEPVLRADATNPANYQLSGGLIVSNALLLADRRTVILTTGPQSPGSNYTVQVTGVRDRSAAANPVAPGAQADFTGWVDEEFVGPFPSWADVKRDYGAVGDGVADDTAALQRALDEVATPGHAAVLYFPTGTYRITQTLNFNTRLGASLVGEDPLTTILKWDGPANVEMMFANGVAYARWTRLTWDGCGRALGAVHHGNTGSGYQVTGNLHTDEVFQDLYTGLYADPAAGGDSHMVVRCHFLRCTHGVATGGYNTIDWHVWDSRFEDCAYGLRSFAGNFHVYRSLFLRSTVADVHCDDTYYGIRDNLSIGSRRFVEGGAPMTIQGNTVVDWLDSVAIKADGPVILLDNTFVSRLEASDGPVVDVAANLLSVGNTFTVARPIAVAGRTITMEDRIVARDSFDLPPAIVPGFLPKANRPIIEVAPGANALAIQEAIDAAAALNGSRPVVHLPVGDFFLDRTLVIPAGCDLQLVGDGAIGGGSANRGTSLCAPSASTALRLAGPARATLRELRISGSAGGIGLVVDNCDQPGARVFTEKTDFGTVEASNLIVDRLDHTEVNLHDFFHGDARTVSVRVIGGPAQAAGQRTGGRVVVFGGGSAVNELSYQVERGGRLMIQDSWYEGHQYQRFMRLTDSGVFTLNDAVVAGSDANPGGVSRPLVEFDDFRGRVSFLNTAFRLGLGSGPVTVIGEGADTDLLLVGCSGVSVTTNTPWLLN